MVRLRLRFGSIPQNNLDLPIEAVCGYNTFVDDLVDSAFIDLLSNEFSVANGPHIGRGSFNSSAIIDLPINQIAGKPLTINYVEIEKMLLSSVQNGVLPQPGINSCYLVLIVGTFVHEPHSTNILGVNSGGFHNPITFPNGKEAVYCLVDAAPFDDSVTVAISHELAEAITNPQLTGWYDSDGNEICDLCPPAGSYTIDQLERLGSQFHGHLISRFNRLPTDGNEHVLLELTIHKRRRSV